MSTFFRRFLLHLLCELITGLLLFLLDFLLWTYFIISTNHAQCYYHARYWFPTRTNHCIAILNFKQNVCFEYRDLLCVSILKSHLIWRHLDDSSNIVSNFGVFTTWNRYTNYTWQNRHDTTRHATTPQNTTRHSTTRYDTTKHDTTWHNTTQHKLYL